METSGSASFQRGKKSSYHLRAAASPPVIFCALAICKCAPSWLRSPCQHLGKWRNVDAKTQWRPDSFSSKALLSMEIAALAARTSKCFLRNLENRKGSIIAAATISAPWLSGRSEEHNKPHQPGTFVTLHSSRDRGPSTGRSRATKLYLDSRPPLPRKPKPELQKKEKYNGRLQKSC
jgi:hypothetical protein